MEIVSQNLDIAWILVCAALVMLMQAGFSCLESGLVRSKNSINVAAKNFSDFCLSSVVFWVFGFGLMYGVTVGGFFGTSGFFFGDSATPWLTAFFIFQLGFCGTATTIVSGAVAERMRFGGYLIVATIISGVIYPFIGHWVWASAGGLTSQGWLEQMGFIDFAGSTVVHSVGGWISLAAIIIIGPRTGRFGENAVPIHGHDLPFVTLGVFLLWFGWFGFNGGSTLGLTAAVPKIIVNTVVSGAFGGMVALALTWLLNDRSDVSIIMNGSLAGLVGITASAHIMTPLAAVGIGSIAAIFMYGVTMLLERFEIDDVVGAVPVHLAAGIWGTLAVAIFADPNNWGSGLGRWDQFVVQSIGVGATFIWAFGIGFILLWLVNRWIPLRIDREGEQAGLNVAEHGASTEILDLLDAMGEQRHENDFSQPVNVEPHTEIGQIARQYNRVLADINEKHVKLEATSEVLLKQSQSLQLLQNTATAANNAKSIEEAVHTCLESICAFGRWQVGHCYMVDDNGKILTSTKTWHIEDEERYADFRVVTENIDVTPDDCLSGWVLANSAPTWKPDVSKEEDFSRFRAAEKVGIRGGAAFPVLVGNDVVAVLEFFTSAALEPNDAIFEIIASVGAQLGRVVERARSTEARFKTIVDNMPASVHLRNKFGQYILVNRKYEEFYGVTNRSVRGKTMSEIVGNQVFSQTADQSAAADREVIEKNMIVEHEFEILGEDSHHTLTDRYFPIASSSGEVIEVGGVEIDITERKRIEQELQEAHDIIKEQKERMEEELNVGREIQMSMVPLEFPAFPDHDEFSIFAMLEPAREVGGDFYDFYFLDEDRLSFCIGDVSGKGVPSALFMAMAKTLIKSRADDDDSTASILTHVNDELSVNNKSCMFVTIFSAIIDINTGELVYTNAGHNPPYIKRADGTLQCLDQRHGPVVGALEGMVYSEDRVTLAPGDLLILFTDGVTEAMDKKDQLFSESRYFELLSDKKVHDAESTVEQTMAAIQAYTGGAEQSDDITVLALKFHGAPEDGLMAERHIMIKNELSGINTVNETFDAFADEFEIPQSVALKFNIIFDELLNNVISYAYADDNEHNIEVRMARTGTRLSVAITDDGLPFNPLSMKKPNIDLSLEDREIGGMGIYLVRNLVDDVSYQRRIGKNVMTMTQNLRLEASTP
jgi:ammonium transporter